MEQQSLQKVRIPEAFKELFKPARFKAYHGGRGGAKSHSFASALSLMGAQRDMRILCGREIQKSIKESVYQLVVDKINENGLSDCYNVLNHEIRGTRTNTTFIFAGLSQLTESQIKSLEGIDVAWIEEAQTIASSSLEILRPTIRKPGSELWFSWNPRHPSDPIDRLFRGLEVPEDAIVREVNYDSNPFFTEELEAERLFDRKANPARYGHIWLGHYEPVAIGAIWDRATLHENRLKEVPCDLSRILVAVDPAVSSEDGANEHGIVVCAEGDDGNGYVLEDATTSGKPQKWATRAIAMFDKHEADAVVIEINQGGDMAESVLRAIRHDLPIIKVRASRGKHVRAEPISALYTLGKMKHVGAYPELEAQMCQMTASGFEGEGSPDRVDALVWGMTELFHSLSRPETELPPLNLPPQTSWMGA